MARAALRPRVQPVADSRLGRITIIFFFLGPFPFRRASNWGRPAAPILFQECHSAETTRAKKTTRLIAERQKSKFLSINFDQRGP